MKTNYSYGHPSGVQGYLTLEEQNGERSITFSEPRVLTFEEDGWQVAECKAFDLVGVGTTPQQAREHLHDVIASQLRALLDIAGSREAVIALLRKDGWTVNEVDEMPTPEADRFLVAASVGG